MVIALVGTWDAQRLFINNLLPNRSERQQRVIEANGKTYIRITRPEHCRGYTFDQVIDADEILGLRRGQIDPEIYHAVKEAMHGARPLTGVHLYLKRNPDDLGQLSPDLILAREDGGYIKVYSASVPHLLHTLASEVGLHDVLFRPSRYGALIAKNLIAPLTIGLSVLKERGGQTQEVLFVMAYLAQCKAHPDAEVRIGHVDQETTDHSVKRSGFTYW